MELFTDFEYYISDNKKILEGEANDFSLKLEIDTSCLVIPELFGQLLQLALAQRPLCTMMFYLENNLTVTDSYDGCEGVGTVAVEFGSTFKARGVDVTTRNYFLVNYIAHTSVLWFSLKITGVDTGNKKLNNVIEAGGSLTLDSF
ncbi:hypothetical protein BDF21DRAFT_396873 [Thamnidium elegans]|nr:hypothetical protein BDF21DRAFT_396873 [Thamnidium elegans]